MQAKVELLLTCLNYTIYENNGGGESVVESTPLLDGATTGAGAVELSGNTRVCTTLIVLTRLLDARQDSIMQEFKAACCARKKSRM